MLSELDTKPKAPAYVRMVESQRDLLLKAVHELRQRCTASQQTGSRWDASADLDKLLPELGVPIACAEDLRDSTPQHDFEEAIPELLDPESQIPIMLPGGNDTRDEMPSEHALVASDTSPYQALGYGEMPDYSYFDQPPLTFNDLFSEDARFEEDMLPSDWAVPGDD